MRQVEVSPSAISALAACERQFAFKYWSGIKVPEGKGALFGTECHGEYERYLKGGQLDFQNHKRAAELVAANLHLLPKPLSAFSEGEFHFVYEGVPFNGRIDWHYYAPSVELVQVGDLKTTKSINKYAKTPEQLDHDPQAIIYGKYGLLQYPQAIGVQLNWVYLQTEGAKRGLPTQAYLSPQNVEDELQALLPSAKEVIRLRTIKPDPNSLAPTGATTGACEAYGGCPYRGECKLTFAERIKSMSSTVTDQLAALKARMAAKTPPVNVQASDPLNPPETASAPPTPAAPPPVADSAPAAPRRGRPPKAKVTDANETKAADDVKEAVTRSDTPPSAHLVTTLYVDCLPNTYTRTLGSLLQDAMALVNEALGENKVDDWRFVDYKGGGMLATAVVEVLRRAPVGTLALDSQSPEGRACLETLKSHAASVVKGV